MVENYYLAKKVISKKLLEEHPMYPFMVCALYGLLTKYSNHKDIVLELFSKTDIIFEKGSVEEILARHNIEQDIADPIHDDDNEEQMTFGASNSGHSFVMSEAGEVFYKREKPFVVCSTSMTNMSRLLNTFCHEMSHLIKGEKNGFVSRVVDNNYFYIIRTGLAHYVYCYKNQFSEFDFVSSFAVLDEAINCLQTTDIMKEILALPQFVEDEKITSFIQTLDKEDLEKDHGYEFIVNLVRPIWQNDSFKKLIESNMTTGNIDSIVSQFDVITGEEGSFEELSSILDYLYQIEVTGTEQEISDATKAYLEIVKLFKEKVKAK